jgi:hypothetical protein
MCSGIPGSFHSCNVARRPCTQTPSVGQSALRANRTSRSFTASAEPPTVKVASLLRPPRLEPTPYDWNRWRVFAVVWTQHKSNSVGEMGVQIKGGGPDWRFLREFQSGPLTWTPCSTAQGVQVRRRRQRIVPACKSTRRRRSKVEPYSVGVK